MSHIAKKPIPLPPNVTLQLNFPNVMVNGPMGESSIQLPSAFGDAFLDTKKNQFVLLPPVDKKKRHLWGTYRTLINNMVTGVSRGFSCQLELVGVGYRAQLTPPNVLSLKLGLSHMVDYVIADDVQIACPRPNLIVISGIDRQRVHQVASDIRRYRRPEPYKGKGIRYQGEVLQLKEGKKK